MDFDLGGYQSLGAAHHARIARHPAVRPTPPRGPDPESRCLAAGDLT
ncbi:hypothetical protein [Streptacidiphilus sp. MAP5-3]